MTKPNDLIEMIKKSEDAEKYSGLSKREYFAANAPIERLSLYPKSHDVAHNAQLAAKAAVEFADALIAKLNA